MTHPPHIRDYFDPATNTVTYLVSDPDTGQAAIIDPVLNYDHRNGRAGTGSAEAILADARSHGLAIAWVLETHAHADHLTAASFIKSQTGARIGIGEHITEVQATFRSVFNLDDVSATGAEFDHLFKDGEVLTLGALEIHVMHTPANAGLCQLQGRRTPSLSAIRSSCRTMAPPARISPVAMRQRSIGRSGACSSLPPETRLFLCHDYKAPGRDAYRWQTSVAEERGHNIHVHDGIGEAEFVASREARDATLPAPVLLLPSIQVNIRAGRLPQPEANGSRYLKIPMRLDPALAKSAI